MESNFATKEERVKLQDALGRRLAANVQADRDLPPFHRATMDGIAINFSYYQSGQREFVIEGIQAAGQPQLVLKDQSQCVEIMTGGMLPEGLDTVVRYEDLTVANQRAIINIDTVEKGQSIHRRGIDATAGQTVLERNQVLTPAEIALLASIGYPEVQVFRNDVVAIVSTGDELVEIDQIPQQWQIRRSNGSALAAALHELYIPSKQFHLSDNEAQLEKAMQEILSQHSWVIITAGVSKGKFDFVPAVLAKLGVQKLFHQVKQRPGKPLWFGRSLTNIVFALPGNPVSTFMCFYRYIRPAIVRSTPSYAILATDFTFKPDLTYFLQVKVNNEQGKWMAYPIPGEGSGDFANLRHVDGFLELPSERSSFLKGESFPFYPFRNK